MTPPRKIHKLPEGYKAGLNAWQRLLKDAAEKAPALAVTLERCRIVPSAQPDWKLVFKDAFSMERAKTRQESIEAKLSDLVGRKIQLYFQVEMKDRERGGESAEPTIPEHMIPASVMFEEVRAKYHLKRRAVQWYGTQGLIPKPERIGREGYYDKRTIYQYFELIQILTRVWDLSLTRVQKTIEALEKLGEVSTPGGKCDALPAMLTFLDDFRQYQDQVFEQYGKEDETTGRRTIEGSACQRLRGVRDAIRGFLSGNKDKLKLMLSKRMLDIEGEVEQAYDELEEVPF